MIGRPDYPVALHFGLLPSTPGSIAWLLVAIVATACLVVPGIRRPWRRVASLVAERAVAVLAAVFGADGRWWTRLFQAVGKAIVPVHDGELIEGGMLDEVEPATIGRQRELAALDRALAERDVAIAILHGPPGAGATAIVTEWRARIRRRLTKDKTKRSLFFWTFTRDEADPATGADAFFTAAEASLSPSVKASRVPRGRRGAHLARIVDRRAAIVVLDGLDGELSPTSDGRWGVRDATLMDFLNAVRLGTRGLVVVTARDLPAELDHPEVHGILRIPIEPLSPAAAEYILRTGGLNGSTGEFETFLAEYGENARSLFHAARMAPGGAIGPLVEGIRRQSGGGSAGVVDQWLLNRLASLEGEPDYAVLAVVAASTGSVRRRDVFRLLELDPVATHFPDAASLSCQAISNILADLERRWLLHCRPEGAWEDGWLSLPPLYRRYLEANVRGREPSFWLEIKRALYQKALHQSPERPATLADVLQVNVAIRYALDAGLATEALNVYYERVRHGDEGFLPLVLGAYEANLAILCQFLESPTRARADLCATDQAFVLGEVASDRCALGHPAEAEAPLKESARLFEEADDLDNAAGAWVMLARVCAGQARLDDARLAASKAIRASEACGAVLWQVEGEALLGWILHLQGKQEPAARAFARAEAIAASATPPVGGPLHGFEHVSFLVNQDRLDDALAHAEALKGEVSPFRTPRADFERTLPFVSLALTKVHAMRRMDADEERRLHELLDALVECLASTDATYFLPTVLLARARFHRERRSLSLAEADAERAREVAYRRRLRLQEMDALAEILRGLESTDVVVDDGTARKRREAAADLERHVFETGYARLERDVRLARAHVCLDDARLGDAGPLVDGIERDYGGREPANVLGGGRVSTLLTRMGNARTLLRGSPSFARASAALEDGVEHARPASVTLDGGIRRRPEQRTSRPSDRELLPGVILWRHPPRGRREES